MNVFRIHIRPKGGLANPQKSFSYCLEHGVLGVGWNVGEARSLAWEDYLAKAIPKYGPKGPSGVRFFKSHVQMDDLLWTRNSDGSYYLGKASSAWKYSATRESIDADIVNICKCELREVLNLDEVPGKIVACFRPRRTIQRIADKSAVIYSHLLWNKLSGKKEYKVDQGQRANLYSFLSSEDCEDALAVYLQTEGWFIIPNSRKADTMSYEYLLIHSKTFQRAIVQVKSGNVSLNRQDWREKREKVFLFQSNGIYAGAEAANVVCVSPAELEVFMRKNKKLMTRSIGRWLEYTE
jgi:hypothetical protein